MELQVRAVIAGLCFGLWPLFMNLSRLAGNVAAAVFSAGTLLVVLPLAVASDRSSLAEPLVHDRVCRHLLRNRNAVIQWHARKAPVKIVGSLFVLMILVQTIIPAVYQVARDGLTVTKAVGFVLAISSAVLLTR